MDPTNFHGWDRVIVRFLKSAGLFQALRGFENDILVLNADVEQGEIRQALQDLRKDLMASPQDEPQQETAEEDLQLQYIHLANGATPVSQTQLIRSISTFLAQNRARNNASNRNEFLRKRRRVELNTDAAMLEGSSSRAEELPTCARTDAVPVNRDVQMKYDIAKNERGPLRRTVKSNMEADGSHKMDNLKGKGRTIIHSSETMSTLERHPGLVERFSNLESHLAVRYVPSPPASLLDRIRFLEDHIIHLERDYPPWAALHFNQPKRGWPPPPRTTPLIVPSHMTSTSNDPRPEEQDTSAAAVPGTSTASWLPDTLQGGTVRIGASRGKPKAKAKSSSLHRAVMNKLEVKNALAED